MSADLLQLHVRLQRSAAFAVDVDTALPAEGVTALFGPSGSGKTTLLRSIAGFERPAAGRVALGTDVWFDAESRRHVPAHRRPVGLLFQDARLFPHLDVAGNLDFAERRRRSRADRSAAEYDRDAVVDALDLRTLLERNVVALSGGERQRVALARTLLTRPALLLLDEPLAALDPDRKTEILPYLEQLPRRFGIPTIYVSHALEEVMHLADRVLVLEDGRIRAHGPTAQIVERLDLQPLTGRLEAGVLVDARVVSHDERLCLTHVEIGTERLTVPRVEGLSPGDATRLRIRARDVSIATVRPEGISIRNVLPVKVSSISPEEGTAFAEVLLDLDGVHLRSRLTRASVEDLGLRPGLPVFALIKSVSFDRGRRAVD